MGVAPTSGHIQGYWFGQIHEEEGGFLWLLQVCTSLHNTIHLFTFLFHLFCLQVMLSRWMEANMDTKLIDLTHEPLMDKLGR